MKFSPRTLVLTVLVLGLAVALPGYWQNAPQEAEAVVLNVNNWTQFVPAGKEVDAIYGDIVLRNAHLVAVIAQPKDGRHANMTVRDIGGALIDFTTRKNSSDQLSAFYPGKREYKYREAIIQNTDLSNKKFELSYSTAPAEVKRGKLIAIKFAAAAADGKPQVVTTYRLAADSRFLEVLTELKNPHSAPLTVELADDARIDGGKEDMQKSPNGEAKMFWAYDRFWNQAYGLTAVAGEKLSGEMLMNSDARVSTFQYKTADGKTSVTLAPGESITITRRLWAGPNLLDVMAGQPRDKAAELKRVKLALKDRAGQPISRAIVELFDADGKFYGSASTTLDGQLEAQVPAGKYEVRVTAFGRRIDRDSLRLNVTDDQTEPSVITLEKYQTGHVEFAVTDGDGRPIPCKVAFHADSGEPLNFGPETADDAVRNLSYTPNGKFTQTLPVDEYRIVVSHGPEYDRHEQTIAVVDGHTTQVAVTLNHSVDTAGWVSSDFHSHSSPSGDNTGSQLGRVLNLVAEHIEFAPCTEHNRVDTYEPHIEALGIKNFLATVSGMELTGQPLPLNHQNAFPMKFTPHVQDGGGPVTADNLEDQIERLALWDDRSEKLLQVNHPDAGWMFYDKDGDGKPDAGFERAVPFMDVVEIHPVDNALHLGPVKEFPGGKKYHNSIFRWLQLLNQGYRIYGVVNTDAHYNFHGSGWLRNWIQSSTDDPAKIDPMEMVHAAELGRLVMSNGPFLEVWASEPGRGEKVTSGQDLIAKEKRVAMKVKVQTPNWIDIDRVFVLVNGRVDPKHDYSREQTPDVFRNGVVKFDETLEIALEKDAHLIVVAGDVGGNLVDVMGPQYGAQEPAALTNPIYVDIDGNGFDPNKDTLDYPLPVKFGVGQ